MGPSRHVAAAALAIAIVALGLRIVAALWWQQRLPHGVDFAFGDSHSYWVLARKLASGEPYVYAQSTVFRAPGYPLLLAPLFWLPGGEPPILLARLLGSIFGTMTVLVVMGLAWQLFDVRTAVLAGLGSALYPEAIGMSVFVLSEAPFCPLMLGQLMCWIAAIRAATTGRTISWSALAGVVAGCATLVRPSWILFTPLMVVIATVFIRPRRQQCTIGIAMLATFILVQVPWWVRNERVTGTFVLTTLQTGASLYDGWNPAADGSSDMQFVERFRAEQVAKDVATRPSEPADVRLDRRMHRGAVAWATAHPGRVAELMGIKFMRMWSPWLHASEFSGWKFRLLVAISYLPVLICGLWGALRYGRQGWPYALCVMPAVYFTLLHLVFASSIRYRGPAMLTLLVLAAAVFGTTIWPAKSTSLAGAN